MSVDELQSGFLSLAKRLYSESETRRTPPEVQSHVEKISEFRPASDASRPANGRVVERRLLDPNELRIEH